MSKELRKNDESAVRALYQDFADLEALFKGCQSRLSLLREGDYELSAHFRMLYGEYADHKLTDRKVRRYKEATFYRFSAKLQRSEDRACIVTSAVFREAVEVVPLAIALTNYKKLVIEYLENEGYSTQGKKQALTTRARDGGLSSQEASDIRSSFELLLEEEHPNVSHEAIADVAGRVLRFLTDYAWWCGGKHDGKTIERNDYLMSPVGMALGKAAASNEIAYCIVEDYIDDEPLYLAARKLSLFEPEVAVGDVDPDCSERLKTGVNNIVYGAPGTGKSWFVDHDLHPNAVTSRVVFHPEYSYYDFVGSYKPTPVYSTDGPALLEFSGQDAAIPGMPHIDYRFVPGPFVEAVLKANDDPYHEHCLIIEEINRGDAASIFGDMFQILDRDDNHASAYGVKPQPELAHYLMHAGYRQLASSFRIPSNLSLAATMNSSDLGVTYLDTAFKRRWRYVYRRIRLEANDSLNKEIKYNERSCTLFDLLTAINKKMSQLHVGEDRWVGPFFITPLEIKSGGASQAFEKVVMYLWDDVFRNERSKFFDVEMSSLAEVIMKMAVSDPLQIEDFFAVGTGYFDSEN